MDRQNSILLSRITDMNIPKYGSIEFVFQQGSIVSTKTVILEKKK